MRIFILGGTRFIGPHVVRTLHEAGHEVAVFHRGQTKASLPPGVREFLGDRAAPGEPSSEERRVLRAFEPDVVVDLIAMTHADALATVDTFRGVAGSLVVASSMDVYRAYSRLHRKEEGAPLPVPFAEDGPLRVLRYPYRGEDMGGGAASVDAEHYEKQDVEAVVLAADLPATVLRFPAVYGPHDANHRLRPHILAMDAGHHEEDGVIRLPRSYADWRWTQEYVENVAHAVALAATDERARGVYNVGPEETLSMSGIVEALGAALGWTGRVEVVPDEEMPLPGGGALDFRHHLVGDTSRIREELDYRPPVDLAEAFRRTAAWERATSVDRP